MGWAVAMLVLCATVAAGDVLDDYAPQQHHIALTHEPSSVVVTFVTFAPLEDPSCRVAGAITAGATHRASYGSWDGYIHQVTLRGLTPDTEYTYQCGSPTRGNWGAAFPFRTAPGGPRDFRAVLFGDQGTTVHSARVLELMNAGGYDVVAMAGDLSYANGFEPKWDTWCEMVEPMAARVPWMVAPGNHEHYYDFQAYLRRFPMPGTDYASNTAWYSWDYGHVHWLAYSTEHDYVPGSAQYEFIAADLRAASTADARAQRPWIIAYGHRPMYCSNENHGSELSVRAALESLFVEAGVDLVLEGHVHAYERMWPVKGGEVTAEHYVNPTAPVHVVVGTGGNHEGLYNLWNLPRPAWSAARSAKSYGFGSLAVTRDRLAFEFIGSAQGDVLDEFTIVRTERVDGGDDDDASSSSSHATRGLATAGVMGVVFSVLVLVGGVVLVSWWRRRRAAQFQAMAAAERRANERL